MSRGRNGAWLVGQARLRLTAPILLNANIEPGWRAIFAQPRRHKVIDHFLLKSGGAGGLNRSLTKLRPMP
jgi:hypothetical protein